MSSLPSFSVRNLGPIEEGMVRLHPLTILIGKNNTGKTYMAQAIYSAYKALERVNGPAKPPITKDEADWLLSHFQDASTLNTDLLQGPLRHKADTWIRARLGAAGLALQDRLKIYFDLDDVNELKRWGSRRSFYHSVGFGSLSSSDLLFGTDKYKNLTIPLPKVTAEAMETMSSRRRFHNVVSLLSDDHLTEHDTLVRRRRASTALASALWYDLFLPSVGLDGSAHYLPAGRSGLLEAWTDVVRLRLEHDRDRLALTGREPAALGGIALDFLVQLQELNSPSLRRTYTSRLFRPRRSNKSAKAVEKSAGYLTELISGDVEFARGREKIPSLTYARGGFSIPVQRASSMVAELAPLLSWIRGVLSPGDLLLIDEPEAHMHPEAILAVARTLVALSCSGVRVLCTTHSAEFLHQVSNLILLASTQQKQDDKVLSIDANQVGVYRFHRPDPESGVHIATETIDPNWGIPEDEYVAVAERLAEETANLLDYHSDRFI